MKHLFSLTLFGAMAVASAAEPAFKFATYSQSKTGFYKATATYAVFTDSSVLSKFANAALLSEARRSVNSFKTELAGMERPTAPYEFSLNNEVKLRSAKLISTMSTIFWYTGGAHPNTNFTARNFALVNGKPKQVGLLELLKPGVRPGQIDDLIIAKLRDAGASEAVNGDIPYFTPPQRDRFVITSKGLTFLFPPYEVGAYVEGAFRAELNWNELKPFLKFDGVLSEFNK